MSRTTEEINKVTGTVIGLSIRLISCAVVLLLLAEGISRGYHFGYEVFSSSAVDETPGRDRTVTVTGTESDLKICRSLEEEGLISDGLAAFFQMKFYDYEIYPGTYTLNTSMTAKEILQTMNQKPEEDAEAGDAVQENMDETSGESASQTDEVPVEVVEEENQPESEESEAAPEPQKETEAAVEPEADAGAEIEIQID